MANEQLRQKMQEALDASLSTEALRDLSRQLDQDAASSAEFGRLRQVDKMLKEAPFERAPRHLALEIMARLAEAMKPENLSRTSWLALALGLSLVMLVAVPLLVSAIGLFLYAAGSAAALAAVMHHIINLLAAVMSMLEVFVQGAQDVMSNSQAPALLLALIPLTGYWMLKFAQDQYEQKQDEENR